MHGWGTRPSMGRQVRSCHCAGSRLAWKQAITHSVSPSMTYNSENEKRCNRARCTFLNTTGGIGAHAPEECVNRFAEMPAKSWGFAFAPVLRFDHFPSRRRSESNAEHYGQRCSSSAFRAAHVTPFCRSCEARRRSSSACCAGVNGSGSCSRLSQSCAISASRSVGDNRTISSRVSSSMGSRIREILTKGNGAFYCAGRNVGSTSPVSPSPSKRRSEELFFSEKNYSAVRPPRRQSPTWLFVSFRGSNSLAESQIRMRGSAGNNTRSTDRPLGVTGVSPTLPT
jgi:hypothetical protein